MPLVLKRRILRWMVDVGVALGNNVGDDNCGEHLEDFFDQIGLNDPAKSKEARMELKQWLKQWLKSTTLYLRDEGAVENDKGIMVFAEWVKGFAADNPRGETSKLIPRVSPKTLDPLSRCPGNAAASIDLRIFQSPTSQQVCCDDYWMLHLIESGTIQEILLRCYLLI